MSEMCAVEHSSSSWRLCESSFRTMPFSMLELSAVTGYAKVFEYLGSTQLLQVQLVTTTLVRPVNKAVLARARALLDAEDGVCHYDYFTNMLKGKHTMAMASVKVILGCHERSQLSGRPQLTNRFGSTRDPHRCWLATMRGTDSCTTMKHVDGTYSMSWAVCDLCAVNYLEMAALRLAEPLQPEGMESFKRFLKTHLRTRGRRQVTPESLLQEFAEGQDVERPVKRARLLPGLY